MNSPTPRTPADRQAGAQRRRRGQSRAVLEACQHIAHRAVAGVGHRGGHRDRRVAGGGHHIRGDAVQADGQQWGSGSAAALGWISGRASSASAARMRGSRCGTLNRRSATVRTAVAGGNESGGGAVVPTGSGGRAAGPSDCSRAISSWRPRPVAFRRHRPGDWGVRPTAPRPPR